MTCQWDKMDHFLILDCKAESNDEFLKKKLGPWGN